MFTEEEKEILHKAGEILYRECLKMKMCADCPRNIYNTCQSISSNDGFDEIGKALQKI